MSNDASTTSVSRRSYTLSASLPSFWNPLALPTLQLNPPTRLAMLNRQATLLTDLTGKTSVKILSSRAVLNMSGWREVLGEAEWGRAGGTSGAGSSWPCPMLTTCWYLVPSGTTSNRCKPPRLPSTCHDPSETETSVNRGGGQGGWE